MKPTNHLVRRAELDDLPGLRSLWQQSHMAGRDLEKRFTEFQLVFNNEGALLGTAALQVLGPQGRIHSEAFSDTRQADPLRVLLWERVQKVAQNNGLARLWADAEHPFWQSVGFHPAMPEEEKRLPDQFKSPEHDGWLTLQLKEEAAMPLSLEQEFHLFQRSQQEGTDKILRQAKFFKATAFFLALVLLALVVWGGVWVFEQLPSAKP